MGFSLQRNDVIIFKYCIFYIDYYPKTLIIFYIGIIIIIGITIQINSSHGCVQYYSTPNVNCCGRLTLIAVRIIPNNGYNEHNNNSNVMRTIPLCLSLYLI
jgi:hypothetical protein